MGDQRATVCGPVVYAVEEGWGNSRVTTPRLTNSWADISVLPCVAFSLERPCEKLRFFQQQSLPVLRHLSIFSRSQTGCAPRPAHVLPDLSRYLIGTFRPFNELPRTLV